MKKAWPGGLFVAVALVVCALWFVPGPDSSSLEVPVVRSGIEPGEVSPHSAWNFAEMLQASVRGNQLLRGRVVAGGAGVEGALVLVSLSDSGQDLREMPCDCSGTQETNLLQCDRKGASGTLRDLARNHWGQATFVAQARSDEHGRFEIEGLDLSPLNLLVRKVGRGATFVEGVVPSAAPIEVELRPGHPISGSVVDGLVNGLPGATITLLSHRARFFLVATTTAAGSFDFGPLPEGNYTLTTWREGYSVTHKHLHPPSDQPLTLKIQRLHRIEGRVLRGDRPVAGAQVTLEDGTLDRMFHTDAKGRFQIEEILPDRYQIEAQDETGVARKELHLRAEDGDLEITLLLEAGGFLEVTVRDRRGGVIAGAKVSKQRKWRHPTPEGTFVTDAEGRTRMGPFPATKIRLQARAAGFVRGVSETLEVVTGKSQAIELQLSEEALSRGLALDEAGAPVAGVEIFFQTETRGRSVKPAALESWQREQVNPRGSATTDPEGGFVIRGLPPGPISLSTWHPDFIRIRRKLTLPDPKILLTLRTGATVAGRVRRGNREPLVGASVRLAGPARLSGRTASDGTFSIHGVPDGTIELSVQDTPREGVSAVTHRETLEVREGRGPEDLEIVLDSGLVISGQVIDGEGQEIPGVKVTLSLEQSSESTGQEAHEVTTDPTGHFRFEGLESAIHRLSTKAPGYDSPSGAPLRVSAGTQDLEIVLERSPTLRGQVVDEENHPVTHFWFMGHTVDDPEGKFALPLDFVGERKSFVAADGFASLELSVTAVAGEDLDLGKLTLGRGRTLRGKVIAANGGGPVPGAVALIRTKLPFAAFVGTDELLLPVGASNAQGEFEVVQLSGKRFNLFVQHPDFAQAELPIAADQTQVIFELSAAGRIEGQFTDLSRDSIRMLNLYVVAGETRTLSRVGEDGTFAVGGLAAGDYQIQVESLDPRLSFEVEEVHLPSGGTARVTMRRKFDGQTLIVRWSLSNGTATKGRRTKFYLVPGQIQMPETRAEVNDLSRQGPMTFASFASAQQIAFGGLETGDYSVVAISFGSTATSRIFGVVTPVTVGSETKQVIEVILGEIDLRAPGTADEAAR